MRKNATPAEEALWQMLRGRKLEGLKFRRQQPLGPYIVDFVCFERRLIIEVDGSQHSNLASNRERDAHFEANGYDVLRFWNDEVLERPDDVARHILYTARPNA